MAQVNLNQFEEVTVDFDQIPFGHGQEQNLYRKQHGRSFHLGIREWPFGNFRIGFLTTELLTFRLVENVFEKHAAQNHRQSTLIALDIPDSPLLYPIKVPLFLDTRARADQAQKPGITQLAKEILDSNPDAVVIANGIKEKIDGVHTFQGCKGKNDLSDKDIFIIMSHLAPDHYAELNVVGQWLRIPNIINFFYMDQINQAVGGTEGFGSRTTVKPRLF
jgi:hypothetical protein